MLGPMSAGGLREEKKASTRQAISNAATALFLERGFDQVTVAEVAAAANVSKMTVFNYFPRKEDLFFDREDETRELVAGALADLRSGEAPVAAFHALGKRLVAERHPLVRFTPAVLRFFATVDASEALRARLRELREILVDHLAGELVRAVGRRKIDADARLVAAMLVEVWRLAYVEGLERLRAGDGGEAAQRAFTRQLARGIARIEAAAADTPYA
jgi:AcrR family transcriptional regulator